jgi:hypothetical protein
VFTGFAMGELVMFQQIGFGVGVALLLDATIIRSVILPSAMRLLGRWNWYLPRWLDWLPRLDVEGRQRSAAPGIPVRVKLHCVDEPSSRSNTRSGPVVVWDGGMQGASLAVRSHPGSCRRTGLCARSPPERMSQDEDGSV